MTIDFFCIAAIIFGISGLLLKSHTVNPVICLMQIMIGVHGALVPLYVGKEQNVSNFIFVTLFLISLIVFIFSLVTLIFRKRSTTQINELTEFRG